MPGIDEFDLSGMALDDPGDAPIEPALLEANGDEALSPQDREWVLSSLPALQGILSAGAADRDAVERVLEEYLKAPSKDNTSTNLFEATKLCIGAEPADALLTAMARGVADPAFFEFFIDSLEADQRPWMRMLTAVYGQRVRDAWIVAGENPHDWRGIGQNLFFDLFADAFRIRMEINKYNGEVVVVEGTPKSYLNLANAMLDPMLVIPVNLEVESPAIDVETVRAIRDKCEEMLDAWTPVDDEDDIGSSLPDTV